MLDAGEEKKQINAGDLTLHKLVRLAVHETIGASIDDDSFQVYISRSKVFKPQEKFVFNKCFDSFICDTLPFFNSIWRNVTSFRAKSHDLREHKLIRAFHHKATSQD